MIKLAYRSPSISSRRETFAKKAMHRVNLGDVSEALERGDDSVVIAFFRQGYEPLVAKKAPGWVRMILDLDALNAKYECWQKGLLRESLR